MRNYKIILVNVVSLIAYGCSNNIVITNNSFLDGISEDRFSRCIKSTKYQILFPKTKNEVLMMEYIPALMDSSSCDGVYYYRYVSKSFRQPKLRDSNGVGYSEYSVFVILDSRIYALTRKSEEYRKRFMEDNENYLQSKFGYSQVNNLKAALLLGVKRMY